jgi:hypothetical protein
MRTFYTGSDIEDMSSRGVRQLEIGSKVALTDEARAMAEQLGIALVTPGGAPAAKPAANTAALAKVESLPSRPKGCQHGPLTEKPTRSETAIVKPAAGPVVEQLVEAVSAMKKRGG